MSRLAIKSGCVEAVFKRGRKRTKGAERNQPLKTERPTPASETPLREAEFDTPQQLTQSIEETASTREAPLASQGFQAA